MRQKTRLLTLLVLLMTAATGAWAQDAKHLITATYREQTRLLEQPLPYATTVGELYEAVTGKSFSDLISTMSILEMPLSGITSNNTSVVSIGDLNGASTPVTVTADGKATVILQFGNYAQGIFVNVTSPLYVTMKDGVKDADKWTVKVGEGEAQALPIGGLKGDGSETVTLKYTGRLKVKGVKAVVEPAAPSVPDGALSGVFSVSDTKQVYFSKGNLQLVGENTLQFAENQWDYFGSNQSDNHRDLLCWGTGNTPNQTTGNSTFTDWGDNTYLQATLGKGWRTMTKDEFVYVFNTRASGSSVFGTADGRYTAATINTDGTGVKGIILFPDGITIEASEVTTAGAINGTSTMTQCTTAQWAALAGKGCVFLPAAGFILSGTGIGHGDISDYWTSTAADASKAYNLGLNLGFSGAVLNPAGTLAYNYGLSVRLVREVATTDAPAAKPAATVTTAPTGAAIVGVGKTTALVSGGVADGGKLMYAVTTTNTKPTSTAGFSDAVPTAETITASGKVYVWYYVKGDDTHSDSEIAATAIEVPVADIVWDVTNVSDLEVWGDYSPYTKEGVKLSGNADQIQARYNNYGDPETDGISFETFASGGYTFTAPTGKAFTKIEMKAKGPNGWLDAYLFEQLGTGWAFDPPFVTWKGTAAASTVGLLTGADMFHGESIIYIAFYLSE